MNKQEFIDIKWPPLDADYYFTSPSDIGKTFFKNTQAYDLLLKPTTYFLLGHKGCGKTLYAAYLCNHESSIKGDYYYIQTEDYKKFFELRKEHLRITDFKTIWKAILLIKILSTLDKEELRFSINRNQIWKTIEVLRDTDLIRKIMADEFIPIKASERNQQSKTSKAVVKLDTHIAAKISGSSDAHIQNEYATETVHKTFVDQWYSFIEDVDNCIATMGLKLPHYLFIDGIDIRPEDIGNTEYRSCVTALIRAAYELNKDMFSKRAPGNGRLQIVLLSRLDIFFQSELNNIECIFSDNSAILEWNLYNNDDIYNSDLYCFANRILSSCSHDSKATWEKLFNFKLKRPGNNSEYDSFEYCLRMISARPRNLIKLFAELQNQAKKDSKHKELRLKDYFDMDTFRKKYSSWYIATIKSEMRFSYSQDAVELFIAFLKTFDKLRFRYETFSNKIDSFSHSSRLTEALGGKENTLNLMYSLNIICFIEPAQGTQGIYRWFYREETPSNSLPSLNQYNINNNSTFEFHWAVEKELGVYRSQYKNKGYNYW